jgi:hypothetical protein
MAWEEYIIFNVPAAYPELNIPMFNWAFEPAVVSWEFTC